MDDEAAAPAGGEAAPAAPPLDLASVRARRHRLFPLEDDIAAHPEPRGDHLINPGGDGPPAGPLRDAAVLVPLVDRGALSTIFTLRAGHLSSHAGQVAFPGGKIDPTDPHPLAAALREAEEEIGISPALVEPIGYAAPYLTRTGYRIFPVLGIVDPAAHPHPNPEEVAAVFEVPWDFLMRPENHLAARRPVAGGERRYWRMPFGEWVIWGVTAGIVRGVWEELYR